MIVDKHLHPLGADGSQGLIACVLDSLTAEIAVVDQHGQIRAVNDAWTQFARDNGGSSSTTGVGVNYLEVCRSVQGNDSPIALAVCQGIEDVLTGDDDAFRLEYPCHSSTEMRWFLLHVSPLKGNHKFAVTAHLSITERKLLEQQLVDAERLAAIGQAMRGLSHEGRNALQRSQSHIDLLRCHIEEVEDREAIQLIDRIQIAQNYLIGLYEEVRDYAEPFTLHRRQYNLNELVKEVTLGEGTRGGLSVTMTRGRSNPICHIDVEAITKVLRLIFDNAVAAGEGLPASERPTKIEVCHEVGELGNRAAVTLIISDDGPGVPPELWTTVFDPFYTTKLHGTGLGLAICNRIVSAHGGRIRLGEPRCGGTSVYLTLPVDPC